MIRINVKYVEKVEEVGKWVRVFLTNGLVMEERARRFQLFGNHVYYDKD